MQLSDLNKLREKDLKLIAILLYIGFYFILLFLHKDVFPYSDDIVFRNYLANYTVRDQIVRTWKELSGKVFTDIGGALFTLLPYSVWSIIDSFAWLAMLIMFGDIIYKKPSYQRLDGTLVLINLFLMFPVYYLTSAGFIMTSSNYVYPAVCDTFIIWRIVRHFRKEAQVVDKGLTVSVVLESIPLLITAFGGTGQEQSSAILITLLIMLLFIQLKDYAIYHHKHNSSFFLTIVSLIGAVAGTLFVFLSPAHISRSRSVEGTYSVPGYADWNLNDKILEGYSSTAANLVYYQTWIYLSFCLLLLLLGLCCYQRIIRFLAFIPAAYSFLAALVFSDRLSYFPEYGWGMKALTIFESQFLSILNQLVPFIVFILICFLIYKTVDNKYSAASIITVLILGLASRVVMGLSATLYGSSFRTFIYLLFCLIFCGSCLYNELRNRNKCMAYGALVITSIIAIRIVYLNVAIMDYFSRYGVQLIKY